MEVVDWLVVLFCDQEVLNYIPATLPLENYFVVNASRK